MPVGEGNAKLESVFSDSRLSPSTGSNLIISSVTGLEFQKKLLAKVSAPPPVHVVCVLQSGDVTEFGRLSGIGMLKSLSPWFARTVILSSSSTRC